MQLRVRHQSTKTKYTHADCQSLGFQCTEKLAASVEGKANTNHGWDGLQVSLNWFRFGVPVQNRLLDQLITNLVWLETHTNHHKSRVNHNHDVEIGLSLYNWFALVRIDVSDGSPGAFLDKNLYVVLAYSTNLSVVLAYSTNLSMRTGSMKND